MKNQQIKKKSPRSYGIYLLVLVLLYSLLMGCQQTKEEAKAMDSAGQPPTDSNISYGDSFHGAQEESEDVVQMEEEAEAVMTEFTVEPGTCLIQILQDLVNLGWGESVDQLLLCLEGLDAAEYRYWSLIENTEERAFKGEGYIAPGLYKWESTAAVEEVLELLLSSWDQVLTAEMEAQAKQQGYTVDDVLIMASIVEWESSFDPYNIVKPQVAAVVRNRIESETALQMDVTIFYLQESLEPYRDPAVYEAQYDTYIRSTLPAGPIGSPSLDSIQAVLDPADTDDLFFVYDEEGNYYFAEDYAQHLINCDLAGIYW